MATISAATAAGLNVGLIATPVAVADTAANVTQYLNGLATLANASKLASIALTDGGTPTLSMTAGTLIADSGALYKITSAYRIAVTSGTVTAAQAGGLNTKVSGHLTGGLAVSDTAANVVTNLFGLQSKIGTIDSISLTGGPTLLSISSSQLLADGAVLGKITGPYTVAVSGTTASVYSALSALEALGNKLVSVSMGVATAAQTIEFASRLGGHLGNQISVRDTGVNLAANLDGLQANIAVIAGISIAGATTPFTVTAAALAADGAVFGKIVSNYLLIVSDTVTAAAAAGFNTRYGAHLSAGGVNVADSAANVSGALVALAAMGARLGTVAVADPVGAARAISLANSLGSHLVGVAVSDSSANVLANLGALQGKLGAIGSIAFTDGAPTLALTAGQVIDDFGALAKIVGAYSVTVTGDAATVEAALPMLAAAGDTLASVSVGTATVAQALDIAAAVGPKLLAPIAVSDAGAAVVASLDALHDNIASIGAITLTDAGAALSVTSAQLANDSDVFAKIGSFLVTVADPVDASTAAGLIDAYPTHLTAATLTVIDSAGNVGAALPTLASQPSLLGSLFVSDAATAAQAVAIATALGEHLAGPLDVADSGANLATAIDALQASQNVLDQITLTDAAPLTVTSTQAFADLALITRIAGASLAIVDPVTIDDARSLVSLYGDHLVDGGLAIADTAAAIGGGLDFLEANLAHAGSIAITDAAPLSLSSAELAAHPGALAALGAYALTVTDPLSALGAISVDAGFSAHLVDGALTIADTAAAVSAELDALQGFAAHIASITISDGQPLTLTSAQLAADTGALAAIAGYSVAIVDPLSVAAALSTIADHPGAVAPGGLAVSDTAAHIAGDLDGLQANLPLIGSLSVSDGQPLAVASGQLTADADALGKIGDYAALVTDTLDAATAIAIAGAHAGHLAPGALTVADEPAALAANLDALQANLPLIAGIAMVGGGLLTLTSAQLAGDMDALDKIGAYDLAVSDPTLAATAAELADTYAAHLVDGGLSVIDTTANVAAALAGLEAAGARLGQVNLTDAATPADAVAIAAGLSVHLSAPVDVAGTGAELVASLDGLHAQFGRIGSITVSDAGTPLSLSPAMALADADVLARAAGVSVAFTAPATAAQLGAILGDGIQIAGTIDIADTTGHLLSHLDALQQLSDAAQLGSVAATTAPAALIVTAQQSVDDVDAIKAILQASGGNPGAVLHIVGGGDGDLARVGQFAHITDVTLGGNQASILMQDNVLTTSGNADLALLGGAATTVHYAVGSGVEGIAGFAYGTDVLDIDLGAVAPQDLIASDVTVMGGDAVLLSTAGDGAHGVVLVGAGLTAEQLTADHLFVAGNHAFVA